MIEVMTRTESEQETLDALLRIAVWEMIFGGGDALALEASIRSLLARGAVVTEGRA